MTLTKTMLQFRHFSYDPVQNQLSKQGEAVRLRQKLNQLLCYFLQHRSRVISKEELLREIWDQGQYRERSLAQSILELRKALGDSASSPLYIRTIPGKGYQWVCPVTEVQDTKQAGKTPETERSGEPDKLQQSASRHTRLFYVILLACGIMSVLVWWLYSAPEEDPSASTASETTRVFILPFENKTFSSSMQWVEYGLSDMLAGDLMTIPQLEIYNPAQSLRVLASRKPSVPTLSFSSETELLHELILTHKIDSLILAQIRLENESQQIRYRILNRSGEELTGELSREDLAVSMPDIASHLYHRIIQTPLTTALPEYQYKPSAMHDYARGVQALQLSGPSLAQHYFSASTLIDPEHYWSKAYLAVCMILLGDYDKAEQILSQLRQSPSGDALNNFVELWLSQLWLRSGETEKAETELTALVSETHVSETNHSNQSNQPETDSTDNRNSVTVDASERLREQIHLRLQRLNRHVPVDKADHFLYLDSLLAEPETFYSQPSEGTGVTETTLKQLSILGHQPALMRALMIMAANPEQEEKQRQQYLSRALEYARQLRQPYEEAMIHYLRARLILSPSASMQEKQQGFNDIAKAQSIAEALEVSPLIEAINRLRSELNQHKNTHPSH